MPVLLTKDLMRDEIERFGYQAGDHSYGRPIVLTWGEGKRIFIGKYCSFASGVTVLLGGNHRSDWITTYPFCAITDTWPEASGIVGHPASNGDVHIGNDVWLGADSTIMSGITVGNGAVIATKAVVTKNVPPYAVVGGNPARVIKLRFEQEIIDALEKIRWWDWPEDRVRSEMRALQSDDVVGFVRDHMPC